MSRKDKQKHRNRTLGAHHLPLPAGTPRPDNPVVLGGNRARHYAIVFVLTVALLAVFLPLSKAKFLMYDDPQYVTANPMVQQGFTARTMSWAFTTIHTGNWHPITWLSHMLDHRLFDLDAGRHHLVNVAFHLVTSGLLLLVLDGLTGKLWIAALTAGLFALHPLHVQSVAWIAERKDVLSGFLFVLTLLCYRRYVARPEWSRYLLLLLTFGAGLMAKPMLVSLPLVLLLLDYWPLDRLRPDRLWKTGKAAGPSPISLLSEKIPLFAFAAASAIITYFAQSRGGMVSSLTARPLGMRLLNAVVSYEVYLRRTLWPSDLAVFYPLSREYPPGGQVMISLLILLFVSAAAFWARRARPCLIVGWLWFLGTLVPVIGVVQVGEAALADRYSYIPLVGLFLAGACGLGDFAKHPPTSTKTVSSAALAVALLIALGLASHREAGFWRDDETLFSRALQVTEGNWVALATLATIRMNAGRLDEAAGLFEAAIRAKPANALAYNNLGIVRLRQGRVPEAVDLLNTVVRNEPNFADAHFNLAGAYDRLGRHAEAAFHYRELLRIDPADQQARYLLGQALEKARVAP